MIPNRFKFVLYIVGDGPQKNELVNLVSELDEHTKLFFLSTLFTLKFFKLKRDLYIVLGDGNFHDGWVVRLYYNPLVIWIWIGVFVIFLGGLIAIRNNLQILKRLNL